MRIPAEVGPRPLSDELAFVCRTLRADEADILAKALRRGVFEIYKAVVLHETQSCLLYTSELPTIYSV